MATLNDVPDNAKQVSIGVLQGMLVDMIDLTNATRQAHWNVKGPYFAGLHKLFEEFYTALFELADTVAERIVQLGAIADGTTQTVVATTRIEAYPSSLQLDLKHAAALAERYSTVAKGLRAAISSTAEAGDADTADLLTGASRFVDKALWMIEAHLVT